jgi:phosphate starvation-inducible protein PhoH and related proteins
MLAELCGSNDTNLRLLEELLETPIRYRGNEFFLESEDERKRELLIGMLAEMRAHVERGQTPNPPFIRAVHQSMTSDTDTTDLLKSASITLPGNDHVVFPRNLAQAHYMNGMRRSEIVIGIGPAGTGKTYLAVAYALREVLSRRKRRLVLTRPVVEAGESLGFLPGDLTQKISPYLRPLYDAMEALLPYETLARMEEQHVIEIAPLAYMRGRSLNDAFVLLDEAQNTTREQMKMFLTRIGEGTQAAITGDVTQIDLPKTRSSGLLHACDVLESIAEIQFTYFTSRDVVRNPLVQKIIDAYETNANVRGAHQSTGQDQP